MTTPRAASQAESGTLDGVLAVLVQELGTLIPYVAVLREHLGGAVQATETGVTEVIGRIDRVHGLSNAQVERIQQSLQQCLVLVEVTRQQGAHSGRVVELVRAVIDGHLAELDTNKERSRHLEKEVRELRKVVEVITEIASQTHLLAINAAVQATHAGPFGAAFAVVAAEVKALSRTTAGAAKEITSKIGYISERMTAEVALAEISAQTVRGSAAQLQEATAAMGLVEARYGSASGELQGILGSIMSSNGEVVTQLTEALGHIQFQDILRQRVGQVEAALLDLGEHAEGLVGKLATGTWDGGLDLTLKDRMARHLAAYVMANQRTAHAHAVGWGATKSSDGPAIELF